MSSHSEIAARFFKAIETGDIDAIHDIYAPNAVIWHNTDGLESTRQENMQVLANFVRRFPERRYEERRLQIFPGGFVQQHELRGVRRDGTRLSITACLVCLVENERIVRLDEYFDSAALAPWLSDS